MQKSKSVTVKNIFTGEYITYNSVKEAMYALGCSQQTLKASSEGKKCIQSKYICINIG